MRYFFSFILICFELMLFGQDCTSCPAGSAVNLTSNYPTAVSHSWVCTDGFTSTSANPTFYPTESVTCYLTAIDSIGCVGLDTLNIEVCNCDGNNPCVNMAYHANTDCVVFTNTGSASNKVIDKIQWKNANTSWANVTAGDSICDCSIKEYINTSASVSVNGSNFRLEVKGLKNRCHTCSGSDLKIKVVFPVSSYGTTMFPGCGATEDWFTISPSNFASAGYVANVYVMYNTPFGQVINYYTYTYNGGGLNVSNVSVTEVYERSIYKDIDARRIVTYSDGCPSDTCQVSLDIPQQPSGDCTHFLAIMEDVNMGGSCGGSGAALWASTYNATGSLTYQWYYNGAAMSGETDWYLCKNGLSSGTYCVEIEDSTGCVASPCTIIQPPCNLSVTISESGGVLTANLTNCSGSPSYQWQKWTGSTWTNVGTSSTYNTSGVAGDYRVQVTCTGCSAIAYYTYTPPCTASVSLSVGSTTLTATVSGCGGSTISYVWERRNGTSWTTVRTQSKTATTDTYTPTVSGLHRVTITCNGCSDQAQAVFTLPDPCATYNVIISFGYPIRGWCTNTNYTFTALVINGTAPYTYTWKIGGTTVSTSSTYVVNRSTPQTITLVLTVVDASGCSKTASVTINIIQCCYDVIASISPSSASVCTNTNQTYTASASGGSSPYAYQWQTQLPPNAPVSQGSGASKIFNFGVAGTYNITVTATDNVGCSSQATATMTVTTCTDCTCTPTLTLSGCQLNGSFSGAGCSNFTYQLQYSPSGSGWTTVASGTASNGGTFSHTPTANGIYRLVIASGSCSLGQTPDVVVNCVVSCGCTAGTLSYDDCWLSWTNPCAGAGYTASLERQSGSWAYVTQTTPYWPTQDGNYRVVYRKAGCPDVTSNTVSVNTTTCGEEYNFLDQNDSLIHAFIPTKTTIPQLGVNQGGNTVNNKYQFIESFCWSQPDYSTWTIDYGDGSGNSGSAAKYDDYHTYSSNGIYTVTYDLNSYFGAIQDIGIAVPDGTPDMRNLRLEAGCYDGGVPIAFDRSKCDTVGFYLAIYTTGSLSTTPTYISHSVKVNGTTYPSDILFVQPAPNVVWMIDNTKPIYVPLNVVDHDDVPVEVSMTFSISGTSYTIKKKMYVKIICS